MSGLTGLFAVSCTTAPTEEDFRRYEALYRDQARPDLEQLERDRAAGTLTPSEYTFRKQKIEDGIAAAVSQAIFTHHQLETLPPSDKDVFARPHGIEGAQSASGGGGRGGSRGGGGGGGD